jgi:hypothetical protein
MKISEIVSKIDLRDPKPFFDFTNKWIGYVTSKKASVDITTEEWSELFGRNNPVAGIDRGELLDEVKQRNGKKKETNEKKSIINKWDSDIRPFIEDTINITEPTYKIAKIKELYELLFNTIVDGGGFKKNIAINRILITFFPDCFIHIPNYKNLKEFMDLLNKHFERGDSIVTKGNWIDDCYQVKKFFDNELKDANLTASAWWFYTYIKQNFTIAKDTLITRDKLQLILQNSVIMDRIEKYKEYIRQCTSSPNSADNYSDFKRLDELISNRYEGFTSISDCDDPDYLQSIYDDLDKLESFKEFEGETNEGKNFKQIGGGQYHNALITYIRFLRALKLLGTSEYEIKIEPILIAKDKALNNFVFLVIEYFAEKDNLDALVTYSSIPEVKLIKIAKEDEFRLTGMFIETTFEDVEKINREKPRWFTKQFTLKDKHVYLSSQWYGKGDYTLTLDDFVKMIQYCYGKDYYYQITDNKEHQLWYNPSGSSIEISDSSDLVDFNPSEYKGDLSSIILYGPPGTGKTFTLQKKYISKFNEKNRDITTFHQAFSYEEFIEGLKPVLDDSSKDVKYDIEKGIFYRACEKAAILADYASLAECLEDTKLNRIVKFNKAIEEKKTVLLCIDEINRGNVAAIFGDLISLIESTKRLGAEEEMTAILPYSKKEFGVPANLLIVGTMNTADRSIQLLDSALRRRFKFVELLPNYTKDIYKNEHAITILKNINARVRCLLNKDNQIGHSYFMKAENYCDILSALLNKVIPLLEEYFYNDIDKVRFVLDDKDKESNFFYVEDTEAKKAYEAYMKDYDEERNFYQINPEIASAIESNNKEKCKEFLANLLK